MTRQLSNGQQPQYTTRSSGARFYANVVEKQVASSNDLSATDADRGTSTERAGARAREREREREREKERQGSWSTLLQPNSRGTVTNRGGGKMQHQGALCVCVLFVLVIINTTLYI